MQSRYVQLQLTPTKRLSPKVPTTTHTHTKFSMSKSWSSYQHSLSKNAASKKLHQYLPSTTGRVQNYVAKITWKPIQTTTTSFLNCPHSTYNISFIWMNNIYIIIVFLFVKCYILLVFFIWIFLLCLLM
jgi:hypothetical protein